MNLRVLIVDDERLAREKIRRYLESEPDVEIVGECESGGSAVTAIRAQHPDAVFLDVQMPGGGGFDVLAEVGPAAMAVIFVTAHDEYAVRAFEVQALDYLLKPFDRARFRQSLGRARTAARPLRRLIVREGERIRFVPVERIDWIAAADNYVIVHAAGGEHLMRDTLARLETRLDTSRFARIHRGAIVNLDAIVEVVSLPRGEQEVRVRGDARLRVGRTYRDRFLALCAGLALPAAR
jgi:two-component system, LytTR family, response regulator